MKLEERLKLLDFQGRTHLWLSILGTIVMMLSIVAPVYTAPSQQASTWLNAFNQKWNKEQRDKGSVYSAPSGLQPITQSTQLESQEADQRILIFLVEGNRDCCMSGAATLIRTLENLNLPGIEIVFAGLDARNLGPSSEHLEDYTLPWNSVRNRHEHWFDIGNNILRGTENFAKQARAYIDEQSSNTSLIFIGHSFGGDSILSFVNSYVTRHNILFVGVIDPVDGGGIRATIKNKTVPSNVRYLFNRWQTTFPLSCVADSIGSKSIKSENCGWPIDYALNGSVTCKAQECNQKEQSESRKSDGSADRVRCGDLEIGCVGAKLKTERQCGFLGCFNVPVWDPGTKNKPVSHQALAYDPYIQQQIIDIIRRLLIQDTTTVGCGTELSDVYVANSASADGNGSQSQPVNTISAGIECVADNGTIWIAEGSYNEALLVDRPVILRSSGGTVTIDPTE